MALKHETPDTLPSVQLRALFVYDHKTGELRWRHGTKAGRLVGYARKDRRRNVGLEGKNWYVHRLIWRMVKKRWPRGEITMLDGDPSNTRIANMVDMPRAAIRSKGRCGRKPSSGYRGVTRVSENRWAANVTINAETVYLGCFADPAKASEVVEAACRKRDGAHYRNPNVSRSKVKP